MKRYGIYIIFILSFLAAGCNLNPFSHAGTNLLGNTGLDEWFHTATGTVGPADETYLNFSQVSASGGYNGTPAYRLELKNLMPNGDFVTGNTGTWNDYSATTFEVINSGRNIDGNSLHYVLDSNARIQFSLDNLVGGAALSNTAYRFRFNFNIKNKALYDYHDGTNSIIDEPFWQLQFSGWSGIKTFPDDENLYSIVTTPQSGSSYFSVNTVDDAATNISQEGYIDNFHIVKAHGSYGIAFKIEGDTAPSGDSLLPGDYRFSVYIKEEANADVTPSTGNRFRSDYITLRIKGPTSSTGTTSVEYSFTDGTWSTTNWTKLSVTSSSLSPEESDIPITLALFPYNPSDRYSGSILISAPQLEFVP